MIHWREIYSLRPASHWARSIYHLATQRVTIAKIAGISGELALQRLTGWAAARQIDGPNLWSPEQWPDNVRQQGDEFADRVRANGFALPITYFAEWLDMWSMGDLIQRWLVPPNGTDSICVHGNRFEVFAYRLPDGGHLAQRLFRAGPQQFSETDWLIARLREAIEASENLAGQAAIVVLRQVVGGTTLDETIAQSLQIRAEWLL
jgi:hypothetical protein